MTERDHGVLGRIGLAHELRVVGCFDKPACGNLRGRKIVQRVAAVGSTHLQLAELTGVLVHIGQLRVVVQIFEMPRKIRGIGHHAYRVVVDVLLAVEVFDDNPRAGLVEKDVVERRHEISHERNLREPDTDRTIHQRRFDFCHGFEVAEEVKGEVRGGHSLCGIGSRAGRRLGSGHFVGTHGQPLVVGGLRQHIKTRPHTHIGADSQHRILRLEGQAGLVPRRHRNDLGAGRDIRHGEGHRHRVFHRLRAVGVALRVGDHQRRAGVCAGHGYDK